MPIPDFQSIMLPLLQYLGDGEARTSQESFEALVQRFLIQ